MPQIAQIDATFASQLFWLIVTFGIIYLVIGRGMLPKIGATVDARDKRISDDLAEAARIRAASEAAMADIETVAAEAARDMVARLSGTTTTQAQAAKAVKAALANG